MTTTAYTVTGMNCGHCVQSVTEELERLPTVSTITVDLADGRVTVVSEQELAEGDVRAAISEAGFELVGRA
ncbi:heavy-metal-associated domain-containing protein [Frankia sp. R82]|uniref:heavy-metal-associated domain-containing protein n=1 Tax=Frankia sp. R82 TaxID=2950553 RepID=UPI0020444732|nr:heavy-metal-associated domain-containing protein [Frankia sp. R82]MCM3883723.1 heavy-metal-associated domain-containing protein [Frankia sp. R82]